MRRTAARALLGLSVLALLVASAATTVAYTPDDRPSLGRGIVERPADGPTVVGVQGFHLDGRGNAKKPPRLVSVGPDGNTRWVHDGASEGIAWFYDVDPLPGGTLLVTSIRKDSTVVYEFDRENRTRLWTERIDARDTHDIDRLPNGNLVVANMRNYDRERGVSDDRVFVYDRETDEVVWEWTIREHFPNDTDGGFRPDWSHVNDVDAVEGGDAFLVSLRNFDQVVKIDRETKRIEWRLGRDEAHDTLFEQHNPDLLATDPPTVLVADSENDRVLEYARRDGEWVRTWTLSGDLSWPRDADRLPNGNTLVTDTLNHRVIEVTPEGRVVWEYYATWGPYDAERIGTGAGSNGPTIAAMNATGRYTVSGGGAGARLGRVTPAEWVRLRAAGTPVAGPVTDLATRWSHVAPWVRPVWLPPWGFAYALLAACLALAWGLAELVLARAALLDRLRRATGDRSRRPGD